MVWNTIYEPTQDRFVTPVTRRWCLMSVMQHFGCYVLFEWDTFFGALLCAIHNKDFAIRQVESIFEEFRDGCIPLCGSQVRIRSERSQPPVGSYCILKLYEQYKDISILKRFYQKLEEWNKWWFENRDGNHDGLLEWGCNLSEEWPLDKVWLQQDAYYESGMDNSPVHDGIEYDMQAHTLCQNYIDLNSLYALDCLALSRIFEILGEAEKQQQYKSKYDEMKKRINEKMWNEELGIYCNLRWDNSFNTAVTPGSFYPLIARIAPREYAMRMVNEWLLNDKKFYGKYMLPSITRDHPAYKDNNYWRGRVWGSTNFLVLEGLKSYGYYDEAYMIAAKSRDLFNKGWLEDHHIYENYNADTGEGNDVDNADSFYTWGGLLAYIYLSELAEAQAFGGIRFGNLSGEKAMVEMPFENDVYIVKTDQGLTVKCNGRIFLESSTPVLITGLTIENGILSFALTAKQAGVLKISLQHRIRDIRIDSELCTTIEVDKDFAHVAYSVI